MLLAHPVVLWGLVREYEALKVLQGENGSGEARQRMDDLAYSLCASTGTQDVDAALIAARYQLPGARPEDDSVLAD
ncbi:uncharacterized protein DUF5133 [Streptomyces sp. CEV 2-1]|uniref:DUF5133 domain-containing protein n=1 Tax=Streptomyces sp. CEV 2-1 TaxID=2485153 RepID=UPI000F491A99|nr:DUF5133 domain-containing protein [Streptomyces sp. CEV 2-1]ROQ73030.1 uncharacterized protein DUF5133 [Streptomyces sp. CEV 2-1]